MKIIQTDLNNPSREVKHSSSHQCQIPLNSRTDSLADELSLFIIQVCSLQ